MLIERNNGRPDHRRSGSSMVRRFSLISLVAVGAVGLALTYYLTSRTQEIMYKAYADVTAANVKAFFSNELTAADFQTPLSGARLAKFREHNAGLISNDILKIKLWNKQGMVIYSSDEQFIGRTYPIKEDLEEALEGRASSEITDTAEAAENQLDRSDFGQVVETYVPVIPHGSDTVEGSYEIYSSVNPILAAVDSVKVLLFAGLLALYLLLVLIVRWASAMLVRQVHRLQDALAEVRTLNGLIPICSWCKKVRDDQGYWNQVEKYVGEHSEAEFTHGICPECSDRLSAKKSVASD